jgi:hypothetical protein
MSGELAGKLKIFIYVLQYLNNFFVLLLLIWTQLIQINSQLKRNHGFHMSGSDSFSWRSLIGGSLIGEV